MAELFLTLSGQAAQAVVAFYLEHQLILNSIVALYGIILAIAHQNLKKIEIDLKERYADAVTSTDVWGNVLKAFADDPNPELIGELRTVATFPFVASPYFFSLYRIDRPRLVTVIGKKHSVPRQQLNEIVESIDTTEQ